MYKYILLITSLSIFGSNSLSNDMRKLWSDHVIWTRNYVVSAISNGQDLKQATDRLLQNQQDIGNALGKFYGRKAGEKTAKLLKEHILIAADLIEAAKAGNNEKVKEEDVKWHKNAQDISVFLNKLNKKYWQTKDMQNMFNDHLRLTTDEVVARIKKDWNKDIESFDEIFKQALHMADMFTDGIVKQFPKKFKSVCPDSCTCKPCLCK